MISSSPVAPQAGVKVRLVQLSGWRPPCSAHRLCRCKVLFAKARDGCAAMARLPILFVCAALSACAPGAPAELAGLWSVGEAACAQGRGLTFDAGAITVHGESRAEPLVDGVRDEVRAARAGLRVSIRHALPGRPGGVDPRGGVGVVDLELARDGWLRPVARRFEDGLTGSARTPLHALGYADALLVRRCALPWPQHGAQQRAQQRAHPTTALRGRTS